MIFRRFRKTSQKSSGSQDSSGQADVSSSDTSDTIRQAGRGAGRSAYDFATRSPRNRDRFAMFRQLGQSSRSFGSAARETLLPTEKLDMADMRAGFEGRYSDRGAARFRQMMADQGIGNEKLRRIADAHARQTRINFAIGAGTFLASMVMMRVSEITTGILGGAVLGMFSLAFLLVALRHDYARWQIRVRRMDGLRAYMDERFSGSPARPPAQPPSQGAEPRKAPPARR